MVPGRKLIVNFKLRRLVRTSSSEQYALSFLSDGSDPVSVGKLDLHYTDDLIIGTFLVWDMLFAKMNEEMLRSFIDGLVADLSEAIGLPAQYVVEYFRTDKESFHYFSNVEVELSPEGAGDE